MHLCATQFFRIDYLTNGSLHQRRTSQIKAAALGHQNLVA